jgi:hypothetical protein
MKSKIVCCLTVAMVSSFGEAGEAQELQINTPNASISKERNGSIEINTGNSRIRTSEPGYRSQINPNYRRYSRYRYHNQCYSENVTQNSVTQVTRQGRTVINSSISTHQCD